MSSHVGIWSLYVSFPVCCRGYTPPLDRSWARPDLTTSRAFIGLRAPQPEQTRPVERFRATARPKSSPEYTHTQSRHRVSFLPTPQPECTHTWSCHWVSLCHNEIINGQSAELRRSFDDQPVASDAKEDVASYSDKHLITPQGRCYSNESPKRSTVPVQVLRATRTWVVGHYAQVSHITRSLLDQLGM
jgi:hypothetical protein